MLDLLMIGLLQAAAGEPQAPPPEAAPAEQAQPAPEENAGSERVICRDYRQTGTRFTQRRCYRAKDVEERRAQDQQHLRERQIVATPGKQ